MRIVIAGGSGFLGLPLAKHFAMRGFEIVVLSRRSTRARPEPVATDPLIRIVPWEPTDAPTVAALGDWAREVSGADAVINLAGAGIADRRWSAPYKAELRRSRLASTRTLALAVEAAEPRPPVFIQGSAVGYYGTDPTREFDESSPAGTDFLGEMCRAWEAASQPVAALGVRTVLVRTGIVLAKNGGALAQMAPPFKFFVGGRLGSGRQTISWIHRDDWIAMVDWALEAEALEGPINATAPEPVTNAEFSKALGAVLRRPSWLPVPGFALRAIVGELAPVGLLAGQRVLPRRPLEKGFVFRYPNLALALHAIYRATSPL